jgi:ABC-type sugar transport system permease subunit
MNDTQVKVQDTAKKIKKPNFIMQKYNNLSFARKNAIAGYLFISPFIIGFLSFMFFPIIESIRMAFSDVKVDMVNNRYDMPFTGLDNLKWVFTEDPEFNRTLVEELQRMLFTVPAILIFSFFVALLLNQTFKARGFVRSVFFLPVILSAGVMLGLETNSSLLQGVQEAIREDNAIANAIIDPENGWIVRVFAGNMDWLTVYIIEIINSVYNVALTSGIQIIIFLSGLQTISPSMYEASKIEGATAWESFWKITFPMISSLILVNVVYSVIDYFVRSDNRVMELVSQQMQRMDYGETSAMAWAYFGIVIVVLGIVSAIISKGVYYYE